MRNGWKYRVASIFGVTTLSALAVMLANTNAIQTAVSIVPMIGGLPADQPNGGEFLVEIGLTVSIFAGSFLPLYKPHPRRILDTITVVQKRTLVAVFALATIGYFDYTYRIPRLTLLVATPVILVMLPAWFVWLCRPETDEQRTIVVGDDPTDIRRIVEAHDESMLGYVAPPTPYQSIESDIQKPTSVTDGGQPDFKNGYVGGLSRLEDIIEEHSVDSVILAFEEADRAEFFGTLYTCHEHGIKARTHIDHVDSLLINPTSGNGPIVDINLEPWDPQDRLFKRIFDLVFVAMALLILSPVILLIGIAIKIEGNGPILFEQERTFRFGDTFSVYKFRTLKPVDETVDLDIDGARRTPLGDFLRITHLDEIPQLWSILVGDMSVVGPRPAITELEPDYQQQLSEWRRRWFVKPGLTGLAQINDATGKEPAEKLRYDIEYIRKQSFVFDIQIVLRQIWKVVQDFTSVFR